MYSKENLKDITGFVADREICTRTQSHEALEATFVALRGQRVNNVVK